MRMILTVASGPLEGRRVLLRPGQSLSVGRTEDADFSVACDELLSKIHFQLSCAHERCLLRDLESRNGTRLNGQAVVESEVRDGDELVAGETRFVIGVEAPSPARVAAIRPVPAEPATTASGRRGSQPRVRPKSDLPYEAAFRDEDAGVRREAMLAAAWQRESWLLAHCREAARKPADANWEAVAMLAILGLPDDLEILLGVARDARWGARRFSALASFGHPGVIGELLVALSQEDPQVAVSAGRAFVKLTGKDIDSEGRTSLPPENGSEPDEFEQEFLEEAFLPDPQLAQHHWAAVRDQFAGSTRIRRGFDISGEIPPEVLEQLDMEARCELMVRQRYHRPHQEEGRDAPGQKLPPSSILAGSV